MLTKELDFNISGFWDGILAGLSRHSVRPFTQELIVASGHLKLPHLDVHGNLQMGLYCLLPALRYFSKPPFEATHEPPRIFTSLNVGYLTPFLELPKSLRGICRNPKPDLFFVGGLRISRVDPGIDGRRPDAADPAGKLGGLAMPI